ncbi:hypothetical protein V6N12_053892 [Hibiscus sabdariffa]|uniref:Uncharacterized protein n=1 Tax=Hibiscus sabdariffa TaxID=183260 RepID=A0ABR2D9Q8_9ROSI
MISATAGPTCGISSHGKGNTDASCYGNHTEAEMMVGHQATVVPDVGPSTGVKFTRELADFSFNSDTETRG